MSHPIQCRGCLENQPNQMAHIDPPHGCLCATDEILACWLAIDTPPTPVQTTQNDPCGLCSKQLCRQINFTITSCGHAFHTDCLLHQFSFNVRTKGAEMKGAEMNGLEPLLCASSMRKGVKSAAKHNRCHVCGSQMFDTNCIESGDKNDQDDPMTQYMTYIRGTADMTGNNNYDMMSPKRLLEANNRT